MEIDVLSGSIIGIISLIIGGGIGYFLLQAALKKKHKKIVREAETEASMIKKDKILQAKEKFFQLKADHEK